MVTETVEVFDQDLLQNVQICDHNSWPLTNIVSIVYIQQG